MSSRCPELGLSLYFLGLPPLRGKVARSDGRGVSLHLFQTIALSFVLTACASATPLGCAPGTSLMTKYELFLGQNIGTTGRVSDEDWRRFLADEVTPRYPDGFTVLE